MRTDRQTNITKVSRFFKFYEHTENNWIPYVGKMKSSVLNLDVHVVPAISEESRYSITGPLILKSGMWGSHGLDFEEYCVAGCEAV
jgi:hypothetical protein